MVCVECLIGKQKKPILFKVTEPSSIPFTVVDSWDYLGLRNEQEEVKLERAAPMHATRLLGSAHR